MNRIPHTRLVVALTLLAVLPAPGWPGGVDAVYISHTYARWAETGAIELTTGERAPRFLNPTHDAEPGVRSLDVHGVRVRVTSADRTAIDVWRYPSLIADEHALMALHRRAQAPDFGTPDSARRARRLDARTRIEGVLREMLA